MGVAVSVCLSSCVCVPVYFFSVSFECVMGVSLEASIGCSILQSYIVSMGSSAVISFPIET